MYVCASRHTFSLLLQSIIMYIIQLHWCVHRQSEEPKVAGGGGGVHTYRSNIFMNNAFSIVHAVESLLSGRVGHIIL